jgi:hypothetical protein
MIETHLETTVDGTDGTGVEVGGGNNEVGTETNLVDGTVGGMSDFGTITSDGWLLITTTL